MIFNTQKVMSVLFLISMHTFQLSIILSANFVTHSQAATALEEIEENPGKQSHSTFEKIHLLRKSYPKTFSIMQFNIKNLLKFIILCKVTDILFLEIISQYNRV